ncbi:MAG: hypothetical protein HY914_03205 [Desulfomonile tiedjei]|nr:hypothetical protein [Desulfomonile tiedjei]
MIQRPLTKGVLWLAGVTAIMAALAVAWGKSYSPGFDPTSPLNPDSFLRDICSQETIEPPYAISVWIAGLHGEKREAITTLLETCLKENLRGLGDVRFVPAASGGDQPALLRLRVWFSYTPKPDYYECFDLTVAAVIGRIRPDNPQEETVLDAFAVAGVAMKDLNLLCEQISSRLNLNVLTALRKAGKKPSSRK